jgi:hypothetical protein
VIHTFEVKSNTTPGKTYEVTFDDDSQRWSCDCPFIPRKGSTKQQCSHIWDKQADVVAGKEVLPVVEPESLDEAFGVFTHPGGIKPEPPLVIPPKARRSTATSPTTRSRPTSALKPTVPRSRQPSRGPLSMSSLRRSPTRRHPSWR